MKANRKFVGRDDAVSPVIAVILMVAITVVLAATVYVWVSGFGASGSQSKTASLSVASSGGVATMTLVSVSPNTNWNKLKLTVEGVTSGTYGILVQGSGFSSYIDSGTATAWDGANRLSSTSRAANPGDIVKIGVSATPSGTVKLNLVDTAAGSVISSIVVTGLSALAATTDGISACSGTADTATLTGAFYSKTLTDSAAISPDNLKGGAGGATAITAATHTVGSTSLTALAPLVATDTLNIDANELYDLAGAAVAGTQANCA